MVGWDLEYLEDESIKQYYSVYLVYFGFVSKGYRTRTRSLLFKGFHPNLQAVNPSWAAY